MDKKQKTPAVIIIFLIWIGYSFLSTLFLFITNKSMLGPFFLEGVSSTIYISIILIIYALIFFFTLKRNPLGRKITLTYYSLSILIIIVNIATYFTNKETVINFISSNDNINAINSIVPIEYVVLFGLLFGLLFQIVITTLIIILMVKKKNYFRSNISKKV